MNNFFLQPAKQPPPVPTPTGILFLTPSIRLLGARRSLLELLDGLEGSSWRPFVVCSGHGGLQEQLAGRGVAHSVVAHRAWRKGRHFATRYVQAWQISRVIDRERPSLVHANEFHSLPQALAASRLHAWRARTRSLPVTVHVRLGITPRQIRTYALAKAARIVTVSQAVASLFEPYPSLRERVRIVYNGVDVRRFTPPDPERRRKARIALGLGERDFVVGLVGLISPRKCQDVAVEAVARVREACPGIRLVFAGEPFESSRPYADSLRRSVTEKGIDSVVQFPGFREVVEEIYAALDLNLLISDEEGFGRTIIEAGAMGVASVGAKVGGIPELIEDGKTGRVIGVRDPAALADVLRFAADHPETLREWGEQARRRVVGSFSIEAHVRAMEAVWREVLMEPPSPQAFAPEIIDG